MQLNRVSRNVTALLIGIAEIGFLHAALGQETVSSVDLNLGVAEYTADDRLVFPSDTDRWIAVGTGIGTNYNEEAFDPEGDGPIGLVQMEPGAYDYFRANQRYADGTMFLLTFHGVQAQPEPDLQGFVQSEIIQREIHVIDRQKFAVESRAFFVFSPDAVAPSQRMPQGSECFECHTEHGALDGTFLQFYPPLRMSR